MRGSSLRRGGLDLVADAIDRLRGDWVAVTLLFVLPSIPFFVGLVQAAVGVDMRGALPEEGLGDVALLYLLKIPGWAALAAWCAASARGRPIGVGAAWLRVLRRLPEVLLAGSLAVVAFAAGAVSLIGWVLLAPPLVALAATVSDEAAGGLTMLRRGAAATLTDLDRCTGILLTAALAWLLIALNLLVLLPVAVSLGAGSLGVDLDLVAASFRPDRFSTWAFCGAVATLVVEAFVVASFAEIDADREAESEGVRFDQFAEELEARDVAAPAARGAAA